MASMIQPPAISPMQSSTPIQPPKEPPSATSTGTNVYAPAPTNNITLEDVLSKQNEILIAQQQYYERLGDILHRVTLNQESLLTTNFIFKILYS